MSEILMNFIEIIIEYLIAPILVVILSTFLTILTKYMKRLVTSFESKNKKESLTYSATITSEILEQVKLIVSAAVSSMMGLAEQYKNDDSNHKLSDSEAEELKIKARKLVYDTLPMSLTEGSLLTIIGGSEALDKLIDGLIEKELIDIKFKANS